MQTLRGLLFLSIALVSWNLVGQAQALHVRGTRTSLVDGEVEEAESKATSILRRLVTLVAYGGNPDPSHFPLGQCEGDCDQDSDVRFDISSVDIWDYAHDLVTACLDVPVCIRTSLLSTRQISRRTWM
jgi:hypothetical protein